MHTSQTIFSPPIRIILGVLSWLAFGIAALLAWESISGSSIAGCVIGSHDGCDVVQSSSWSKWLGIPVAVLGLACYASLAALSVMLWIQFGASRLTTTAFLLAATLAAGASVWFIALQVFVIGDFCTKCLITDLCGIAIGAISGWCAYRWWSGTPHLRSSGSSSATLSALRSAIPSNTRLAPVAATGAAPAASETAAKPAIPRTTSTASARTVPLVGSVAGTSSLRSFAPPPSLPIAYGGAFALLLILIGGQIVFPAKTHTVQQVVLKDTLDLSGKTGNSAGNDASKGAAPHVAMRIDTEESQNSTNSETASTTAEPATSGSGPATNGGNSTVSGKSSSEPPPEPKRDRIIELLGGKLTLNVADEPLIGSINAPHVVVEMLSYDCSHCRKTNKMVKKAMSRYGDQVALVVLPLPLEAKCNRLVINPAASHTGACTTARTTIALAKVKPASFPRFHDYLMSGDEKKPPSLASILTKAFGLADRVKLQTVRDSKEMDKTIASYVDLFESLQKQSKKSKEEFGLPIQILGDHIMSGSVEKAEDIYKAWEEHLGVKPR